MSKSLVRPFKCTVCERPFTRQENLKRHVQTHHPSAVSRSYPCPQCDARFSRSDLRKRHIRNCHPSIEMILPTLSWQSLEDELCLPSALGQDSEDTDLYLAISSLPVKRITPEFQNCEAFFKKFHPTMPTLHEPSFDLDTAPKALASAVMCIGALYGSTDSRYATSRKMFEDGCNALEEYTKEDRSRFQETWVLQAYILLEVYGIYVCDDTLLSKAQHIHHSLVGAIRELQMTHDGHASRLGTPESPELMPVVAEDEPAMVQKRWLDFIQEESRKRCIYSIYLLDSQLSIACNLRPQISALEIKYELPCADDLWSAATADTWHATRRQHFRSFNEQDDRLGALDDDAAPSEGSLYSSTQDLLHHRRPHQPSLRLLWHSPFAALVLVTQLQMTSRELTHASCLLSRPKNTQRPLSILTDAQHTQIACALRNVAELAPAADTQHPLWHSFWLTYRYTSLTLSHPDSLLVTGVVETNLPAAIATAGHLARPRSRKENRDIYEDRDVFRILNDLEGALGRMARAPGGVEGENPFLTLLAFKICLVGWRIVRLTMGEAAREGGRGGEVGPGRCNPSRFVLQSVMAAIREGRSEVVGGEGLLEAEVEYLQWVREALLRRSVWPVGRWEAAIVDEAVAGAGEYAAVVRESEG